MSRVVLICAASREAAIRAVRGLEHSRGRIPAASWRYVQSANDLRGMSRDCPVTFCAGWALRRDRAAGDIARAVEALKFPTMELEQAFAAIEPGRPS